MHWCKLGLLKLCRTLELSTQVTILNVNRAAQYEIYVMNTTRCAQCAQNLQLNRSIPIVTSNQPTLSISDITFSQDRWTFTITPSKSGDFVLTAQIGQSVVVDLYGRVEWFGDMLPFSILARVESDSVLNPSQQYLKIGSQWVYHSSPWFYLNFNIPLSFAVSDVCTSQANPSLNVSDILQYPNSLIAVTNWGVFKFSINGWERILMACVRSQSSFESSNQPWDPAAFIGVGKDSGMVWRIENESSPIYECVNSDGSSLPSSIEALDVLTFKFSARIVVLAKYQGLFRLFEYGESQDGSWGLTFTFPTHIAANAQPYQSISNPKEPQKALSLARLAGFSTSNGVWSPGGSLFTIAPIFDSINFVQTDGSGTILVQTDNHTWYGKNGVSHYSELPYQKNGYVLKFSHPAPIAAPPSLGILDILKSEDKLQGTSCPYLNIYFMFYDELNGYYESSSLPDSVTLDKGHTFQFSMVILSDETPKFILTESNREMVNSTVQLVSRLGRNYTYQVTFKDNMRGSRTAPKLTLPYSLVSVQFKSLALSCSQNHLGIERVMASNKLSQISPVKVYVGCHISTSMAYIPPTVQDIECAASGTCVSYHSSFYPRFQIQRENIPAEIVNPSLMLIGGGSDKTSNYSDATLYNPGGKQPLWIPINQTHIAWSCKINSPCSFASISQNIYLFHFQATARDSTYCKISTEFTAAVVGITPVFWAYIILSIGTYLLVLFASMIVLKRYGKLNRDRIGKTHPEGNEDIDIGLEKPKENQDIQDKEFDEFDDQDDSDSYSENDQMGSIQSLGGQNKRK